MKITLNDCISRVNQVLNYPAVAYEDIYHFFDQAMYEINTSLKIALPSVSEMREEHTFDITEQDSLVRLFTLPDNASVIPYYSEVPTAAPTEGLSEGIYVCDGTYASRAFYKWDGHNWIQVPKLYAIYLTPDNTLRTYVAVAITSAVAVWTPVDKIHHDDFDLTEYLPADWWTLFIIPYVCFKFAVRNGDSGELFADEFTQGFQQLQSCYSVPNSVRLSDVAGKPAYAELVRQHLHNLGGTMVFTRAIYDNMRVGNGIQPVFGGFYDAGDWRL